MESNMSCPICGAEYIKTGEDRVCSKCGHVAGYKKIDAARKLLLSL